MEDTNKRKILSMIDNGAKIEEAMKVVNSTDTRIRMDALDSCDRNPQINSNTWVRITEDIFMNIDLREDVSRQIYINMSYENNLTKFIVNYLQAGDVFFDVGAHFGYFSLIASSIIGVNGAVHSFEPIPETHERLVLNTSSHKNIATHRIAAWSKFETRSMTYLGSQYSAFSSLHAPRVELNKNQIAATISVECAPLDGLCEQMSIIPNLIKIDAENAELDVLLGMAALMASHGPAISVEVGDLGVGPGASRHVLEHLQRAGYDLFEPTTAGLTRHLINEYEAYSYNNIVAIKPQDRRYRAVTQTQSENRMRDKRQALDVLYDLGFSPKLCIDIGAAEGTDGLYELPRPWTVVLVEPSPSYQPALQKLARSLGTATVVHGIAGAASGQEEFGMSPEEGFFVPIGVKPADWPSVQLTKYTVDELANRFLSDISNPCILLKIDVDGAELDVLAGAENVVSQGAVVIIECVLLDSERSRFHRIVEWFAARGYAVIDVIEPLYRPGDKLLWQLDLIFAPAGAFRKNLNVYQA